jgi:hypothetical protein
MSFTIRRDLYLRMQAVIPKGERSGWVARLVRRELEGEE